MPLSQKLTIFTFAFVFVLMVGKAESRVWRVEQDGSGDYMVIQDAVDAAASGDTIRIGPGRYDEGKMVTTPGWTELVRVLVTQEELTLIGSGMNETIIGPATPWDSSAGSDKAIEAGLPWGNLRLNVEGFGIENVRQGISAFPMPEMHLRNMRFEGNLRSVFVGNGSNGYIDNCVFKNVVEGGDLVLSYNNLNFNVTNCIFEISEEQRYAVCLDLQGSSQVVVSNCQFSGGAVGIYNSGSSDVDISNCSFSDHRLYGAVISNGAGFEMADCTIANVIIAWMATGQYTSAEIRRVTVSGVQRASLAFDEVLSLSIQECVLASGTDGVVWQFSDPECLKSNLVVDMTNNDWGTTDPDSIEFLINTCSTVVEYVPFVGMPLATKSESLGGVKAMYR